MSTVDKAWLAEQQIGVDDAQREALEKRIFKELSFRVGGKLVQQLNQEQIDAFGELTDDAERLPWLEKTYPDYKKAVEQEVNNMQQEILAADDKVALIESWEQ